MRILLTLLAVLICTAGYAQQDVSAQKVQRGAETSPKEQRADAAAKDRRAVSDSKEQRVGSATTEHRRLPGAWLRPRSDRKAAKADDQTQTAEVAASAVTVSGIAAKTDDRPKSAGGDRVSPASKSSEAVKIQGPHLRMDHPTYNFGDVPRKGGDLVHDFVFTNDGTVPLVVTRVITSCSCLKASYSKRPVAPGESAAIRITYEPHKSEPGSFNKVIQIYSNSVDGRDVITVQGCSISDSEPEVKGK